MSGSQSPPAQFGMIHCLFIYSTDAGTSSCLWSFYPLPLRLLGEISLSLLCSHSSRVSAFDWDPSLHVGRLRASVLRSHRTGLQEQLFRGLWLTQAKVEVTSDKPGLGPSPQRMSLASAFVLMSPNN